MRAFINVNYGVLRMMQLAEQQRGMPENRAGRLLGKGSRTNKTDQTELTTIQKSILRLLERGYTKQQAANKLDMSVHTLDAHLREIYRLVDAHTMTAAVAKAIRERMI